MAKKGNGIGSKLGIGNVIGFPFGAMRTLARGASGPEVVELQTRLAELGWFKGPATGNYDSITEAVVLDLQKAADLEPTGIVDNDTWKVILDGSVKPIGTGKADEDRPPPDTAVAAPQRPLAQIIPFRRPPTLARPMGMLDGFTWWQKALLGVGVVLVVGMLLDKREGRAVAGDGCPRFRPPPGYEDGEDLEAV